MNPWDRALQVVQGQGRIDCRRSDAGEYVLPELRFREHVVRQIRPPHAGAQHSVVSTVIPGIPEMGMGARRGHQPLSQVPPTR